jgi:hypothetical protein
VRSLHLTRGRVGATAAAVAGITSAVSMLALDPASAGAATTHNWASGVTANGTVLNIPATPYESSNGSMETKSLASVPSNPALTASLLNAAANAAGARASVADLNLGSGQIRASVVEATCSGGSGASNLAHAVIAGHDVPAAVPPNTTIAVPPTSPITSVVLNKQAPDGKGGTKVTAIQVSLKLPGAPVAQTVDVSTADCAAAAPAPGGTGSAPPAAPAPKPAQGSLPVTG